ncbi:hypothetical protein LguiA_029935 [Lonicera macranthoides]
MSSQASSSQDSETVSSQASSHPELEKLRHFIEIVIKSQDGKELVFKIRHTAKLKKLLTAYCNRRFLDYASCRFLINGELFPHNKTADELGLKDGAEIDAMIEQMGGGYMLISLE